MTDFPLEPDALAHDQLLTSKNSGELAGAATVPALHREHREAFEQFVLEQAAPWHRAHLTALYAAWHRYNACYFAGGMTPPYLLLAEPITPRRTGIRRPPPVLGHSCKSVSAPVCCVARIPTWSRARRTSRAASALWKISCSTRPCISTSSRCCTSRRPPMMATARCFGIRRILLARSWGCPRSAPQRSPKSCVICRVVPTGLTMCGPPIITAGRFGACGIPCPWTRTPCWPNSNASWTTWTCP